MSQRQARTLALPYQLQPKSRVEIAVIMCTTTSKARNSAPYSAYARKIISTVRAAINEAATIISGGEREVMTALFGGDF